MRFRVICALIFICGYIYWGCQENKKEILKTELNGVIFDIYQDRRNHEVYTFNIKSDNWYDGTFIADFYPKSWLYASVGDSIIKKKGESFITIKKIDGRSQTFDTRIK